MRTLLRITMPAEAASRALKDGTLQRTMDAMFDAIRPEAAYFATDPSGRRQALIVFDLKSPADLPSISEPFFNAVGAEITVSPVMNRDDLKAGLEKLTVRKAA